MLDTLSGAVVTVVKSGGLKKEYFVVEDILSI